MRERIQIKTVKGNAPECPRCRSWNALLDSGPAFDREFKCRDCGYTIKVNKTLVVIKKADKPGMGNRTTYHEVARVNGEDF